MKQLHKFLPFLALLASPLVLAHPGHGESGLVSGLLHPVLGLDHLLAMLAVGLWAIQSGERRWWALPAAFVAMMLAGAGMAMAGFYVSAWVEGGIALSLVLFGLLLGAAARLPLSVGIALIGGMALLHGLAHGSEWPEGTLAASYMAGFAVSNIVLHAAGAGMAVLALRSSRMAWLVRGAGLGIAGFGMLIFA